MATALVTGATAGIGESFCRLLAENGFDLVLVARDIPRLEERAESLRQRFKIQVEVLPADLADLGQLARVEERVKDPSRPIEVLINNAGFGIRDSFFTSSIEDESALLDVLVRAPMRLMHAILPIMKANNRGTVINVSSVASWITSGTYSASKSYLTVMSESMHTELLGTNVHVLALCPGFTRTEFHQRGQMKMSGLPSFMWLQADAVVADAWAAAQAGNALSIPGWQYKILSSIARFGPRPLVRRLGLKVRVKQRRDKR